MGKIISLTGKPYSGKTSIARALIKDKDHFRMLVSHTTRTARPDDAPGEYVYHSREAFRRLEEERFFLWVTPPIRGEFYGTAASDVLEAFENYDDNMTSIMIIVPEVISILRKFVPSKEKLRHFYIVRDENLVRESLQHEDQGKVIKRLNDGRNWDEDMRRSGAPHLTLHNNATLENIVEDIMIAV